MPSAVVLASLVTFSAQMSRPRCVWPSDSFLTIGSVASASYCSTYCVLPSAGTASLRVQTVYGSSSPTGGARAADAAPDAACLRSLPTARAFMPSSRSAPIWDAVA